MITHENRARCSEHPDGWFLARETRPTDRCEVTVGIDLFERIFVLTNSLLELFDECIEGHEFINETLVQGDTRHVAGFGREQFVIGVRIRADNL